MEKILNRIASNYSRVLGKNLVGIYVHGSIAMNCFNENKSDCDFIVVTRRIPTQKQKQKMIELLLKCNQQVNFKGFEMSLVLKRYCTNFTYPTPYELHFSPKYANYYTNDLEGMCLRMHGKDHDLAAHFMVIKERGFCLIGESIESLFGEIKPFYYQDSILKDIEDAENLIIREPVYTILNACRIICYLEEKRVLSKSEGGKWAFNHLPKKYHKTIQKALNSYQSNGICTLTLKQENDFIAYLKQVKLIK